MKIAIDLDDVLANSLDSFIEFYNTNYNGNLKPEDFTAFTLNEIQGMPAEEEQKIMNEYDDSEYYDDINPMPEAKEAISELSKNNELMIVTSRPQKKETQTKKWIEKHIPEIKNINFIRQEYGGESKTKGEVCKELGAEILIEDNLDYAKSCIDKSIKVLLFDYPWNQEENLNPLITRVKSWKEILEILKTK